MYRVDMWMIQLLVGGQWGVRWWTEGDGVLLNVKRSKLWGPSASVGKDEYEAKV